mmetsp:Transcript_43630/g.111084  ORF Transcript_43630/g.111084 Transcript_43630/m.111084 type:complete len:215 (-) Transcript_43630:28-672(-)
MSSGLISQQVAPLLPITLAASLRRARPGMALQSNPLHSCNPQKKADSCPHEPACQSPSTLTEAHCSRGCSPGSPVLHAWYVNSLPSTHSHTSSCSMSEAPTYHWLLFWLYFSVNVRMVDCWVSLRKTAKVAPQRRVWQCLWASCQTFFCSTCMYAALSDKVQESGICPANAVQTAPSSSTTSSSIIMFVATRCCNMPEPFTMSVPEVAHDDCDT